jgi:enterochelin esterase-like enzyme
LILDNLIAAKKATPMLVVMPDANIGMGGFNAQGIENSLKTFEREMKETILPFVENNYRVKSDAADRALAGLSLGGLHTLYTGLQNTNMFSYLGVFSSGWIIPMMNNIADAQYDLLQKDSSSVNKNLKQFWIAMGGKDDIAYKNGQLMMEKLKQLNIRYSYSEYPGGHTWPVWRNNLYNFAPLLFKD